MTINKKTVTGLLALFLALHILSYLSHQAPIIGALAIIFIMAATAIVSWRRLSSGLLIILGELMITSQGHLFDWRLANFTFSLRMALWLVLIVVMMAHFLRHRPDFSRLRQSFRQYRYFLLLGVFLVLALLNGVAAGHNISFIYQDFNGYAFFLLWPIFFLVTRGKNQSDHLLSLWLAAIIWQCLISLSLLFLYGHLNIFWRDLTPLYAWFRDQRIIEVGLYKYNFYRIFMQSQLWVLTGLVVWFTLKCYNLISQRFFLLVTTLSLTALFISLSRSFWLAGVITIFVLILFLIISQRVATRAILKNVGLLGLSGLASLIIVFAVLLFPLDGLPNFDALATITDRTTTTDDAAVSSRWQLLPPLLSGIKEHPLIGHGFGATITYNTQDPRYLASHPDNPSYTTFAFEWGWLDIWYKIGLIGLLTYLLVIGSVLTRGLQTSKPLTIGLCFGLLAVVLTHFFSPYLTHPLGIGYLLLTDAFTYEDINSSGSL